ncbi:flavodoxin [Fusobacterium sp. PH5-44]|uniref:flavodoxin n=1 Tax=unclassified Fusobacterium TaxID=2648384 RepID=UPI003D1EF590
MKRLFLFIVVFGIMPIATFGINNTTKKVLVLYYSRSGNTEILAQEVAKLTDGAMLKIEPTNAYPDEYRATTEQVKKELTDGYLPPIKTALADIKDYDVIFVGYPIWWGTTPTPMKTVFKEGDFNGKIIIPFCTHGGGGISKSVDDIIKDIPNATVIQNPFVTSNVSGVLNNGDVKRWIDSLGEYLK